MCILFYLKKEGKASWSFYRLKAHILEQLHLNHVSCIDIFDIAHSLQDTAVIYTASYICQFKRY